MTDINDFHRLTEDRIGATLRRLDRLSGDVANADAGMGLLYVLVGAAVLALLALTVWLVW